MAISDQLTLLNNTKTAIRTAINNKGGSVGASDTFASYATAIQNLPSGGDDSTLRDLIERDITSITIPSGTTSIGNNAFYGCSSLTSITIPSGTTSIGNNAFYECDLTRINIPNSVTSIGDCTFSRNIHISSVNLSDNLTSIGQYAFQLIGNYQQNLFSIIIPSKVTSIGRQAFQGNSKTSYIVCKPIVPPTLGINVFNETNNCPIYVPAASVDAYKAATNWSTYASRIFAIGDAITFTPTNGDPAISVKNYELATANYVQSTDVPSTIKNGAGALEICEGVDRIGISAFRNGTSLTSATLPSTLTRIDELAFDGCSSLTSVTVNATTPPTLYAAAFGGSYPIYVPAESVDAYKAANNWSTYASRIEAIPVQEHALFDAPPQTATITEDTDERTFVLAFPLKIYYADGTEVTDTYHRSNGTARQWTPQNLTGIIDDPNGDLADVVPDGGQFTPVYDSTNGWTMKYDVGLCLNDPSDPSPLVGKTVTFSTPTGIGMELPADYAEVEGTWVKVRDQEYRDGSFTVTMTGIDQAE